MRLRSILSVRFLCGCIILACSVPCSGGESPALSLASVFSDHMVLQQGQPVPVWGSAAPGTAVSVEFSGQTRTVTAEDSGRWMVILDPLSATAEPGVLTVTTSCGNSRLVIRDVLVGEVWLCSGQSNMQWELQKSLNPEAVIAGADRPLIRLYKTPTAFSRVPSDKISAVWTECTPETVKSFSAVAYYFGKRIQEDLNVPVGLLQSAWGGTRIEPWTPPCGFEGNASLFSIWNKINPMPALDGKPGQERQYPTAISD